MDRGQAPWGFAWVLNTGAENGLCSRSTGNLCRLRHPTAGDTAREMQGTGQSDSAIGDQDLAQGRVLADRRDLEPAIRGQPGSRARGGAPKALGQMITF